jgi:hypothetical protein
MKIPTPQELKESLDISFDTDKKVEVTKPLYYLINKQVYVVPAGFKSDGVSNPFIRNSLKVESLAFGLIHDYFYGTRVMPRRIQADFLALDILKMTTSKWETYTTYYGLRLFGWYVWYTTKKKGLEKYPEAKQLAKDYICKN